MKLSGWFIRNGLIWALMIAPVIVILWFWEEIPDIVPIHWNLAGVADDHAPKTWGMFIGPIAAMILNGIFWLLPYLDPKKKIDQFQNVLYVIQLAFTLFFFALTMLVLGVVLGYPLAVDTLVIYFVLSLFALLGNFMGKFRPNYFVGIRTPWTLESETVWNATHRMAGKIWVGGSLLLMILKLVVPMEVFWVLFFIGMGGMVLIPVVHSYITFKQEEQT